MKFDKFFQKYFMVKGQWSSTKSPTQWIVSDWSGIYSTSPEKTSNKINRQKTKIIENQLILKIHLCKSIKKYHP